jgi:putative spermidine/putrescine transport system substrate-binding protein
MEIDDGIKPNLLEGQLLEELGYGRLPAARDLDAAYRDRFTVGSWVAEEGIVYNVKKFEEHGIPKPQRYSDLFNPKLAGRVSFPDINVGMVVNGIVAFAVEGGGDESRIDPGLDLIKKLNPASFYKSSVELSTKFNSGDIWAAHWHAGWALRVRKAGLPVAVSFAKVKDKQGLIQIGWLGIPKGAKARPAADAFIDRYLDPDVQVGMSRQTGVAPIKQAALATLAGDPELKEVMLLKPEEIRNAYYIDWSKVNINEWVNKWNRVMTR